MASYNRVVLVGNLTRDIEMRYTPSGTAVTEIGLAVNDRVKKNNEWVDETTFVDITLWGRTAEIASEYLNRGSSVLIEGRLKLDSWEQEGKKRSKLRVVGEKMQMLGGKPGGGGGGGGGQRTGPPQTQQQQTQQQDYNGPSSSESSSERNGSSQGPPDSDVPF